MHKRPSDNLESFRFGKMPEGGKALLTFCLILGVTAGVFLFTCRHQPRQETDPGILLKKRIQLCEEFCRAAENGDFGKVRRLVEAERIPPDQPRTPLMRETPLALAIKNRHWDIADYLLSKKASPNIGRCSGFTLLEYAILTGNNDLAASLAKHGADVNAFDRSGNPLLFTAIRGKDHEALHILLEAKANPDRRGRGKRTALHEAVLHNDVQAVAILLKHHADVDAADALQETPLHLAVRRDNAEIIQLLLESGADPAARSAAGKTALGNGKSCNDNLGI